MYSSRIKCRWTTLARDEGILPYFVESSFIDNPKLKLTPKDTFVLDSCSKSAGIKCCEVEKNGSQPKCQAKLHDIRFSGPFENLDLIPHMLQVLFLSTQFLLQQDFQ